MAIRVLNDPLADSEQEALCDLAAHMNTALCDPLLHMRLKRAGLYMPKELTLAVEETQAHLDLYFSRSVTARGELLGALCYVEELLDQKLLGQETPTVIGCQHSRGEISR